MFVRAAGVAHAHDATNSSKYRILMSNVLSVYFVSANFAQGYRLSYYISAKPQRGQFDYIASCPEPPGEMQSRHLTQWQHRVTITHGIKQWIYRRKVWFLPLQTPSLNACSAVHNSDMQISTRARQSEGGGNMLMLIICGTTTPGNTSTRQSLIQSWKLCTASKCFKHFSQALIETEIFSQALIEKLW